MRRWGLLLVAFVVVLPACAHKLAAVSLESTIIEAAKATKRAAGDSVKILKIEVSVVNGFTMDAKSPIPVVPLNAGMELTQATKLSVDVDLEKFGLPSEIAKPEKGPGSKIRTKSSDKETLPEKYMLDLDRSEIRTKSSDKETLPKKYMLDLDRSEIRTKSSDKETLPKTYMLDLDTGLLQEYKM
jgi:hypothetical protein